FRGGVCGVRRAEAVRGAPGVLLKPWKTSVGLLILSSVFLIHGPLGLRALYRRRHFRIPASEAWQLTLGLAIPLLLIPHAGAIRLGTSLYGLEYGYPRLIYNFFVVSPDSVLPRQLLLLATLWLHGCIGLRAWLRTKPWYDRAAPALASLATLVPVLALVGIVSAGLDMRETVERNPDYVAHLDLPSPGSVAAAEAAAVDHMVDGLLLLYLGIVVATFALRAARDQYAK